MYPMLHFPLYLVSKCIRSVGLPVWWMATHRPGEGQGEVNLYDYFLYHQQLLASGLNQWPAMDMN